MQEQVPAAKITRPSVSGIFQRERLFRILDDKLKRPAVWVSGPAGSGKTTLVASYLDARNLPCIWYVVDQGDADIATFFSYMGRAAEKASQRKLKPLPLLTPEYLFGISAFTKRYFENLCGRFEPPFAIVFDDYQEVAGDSGFHDVIASGLDVVPDGIKIIISSRIDPPRQFARLMANNRIGSVGWDHIRFTPDECREVVRTYGEDDPSDETLSELYRKTQGWMAGLVLFTEGVRRTGVDSITSRIPSQETVFDYFANEIFERTDGETREFLLKTAVLPSMTPQIAEILTGISTAGDILSQLYRSHFFIEMRTTHDIVYHYHPLFREFLLSKMKQMLSCADAAGLLQNAAELLEKSGQIEDSAALFRDAGDWGGLVRLILGHAQAFTAQGRGRTVEEWLAMLPEDMLEGAPWLLYWRGICRMPFNLVEGRDYFARAFQYFKREREFAGQYLAWSGVVETYVYEGSIFEPLDRWIAEFETLRRECPEFPSQEVGARATAGIFCALMYRQPHHHDLPAWASRVEEIISQTRDLRLQTSLGSHLILYYTWWTGELPKAKLFIDALESSIAVSDIDPLSFIVWKAIEAPYFWLRADYEKCRDAVNQGLKMSEETGIHVWDFMLCGVGAAMNTTSGRPGEAWKFLDRMRLSMNVSDFLRFTHYNYFGAFALLCQGNLGAAYEYARSAFSAASKANSPFYVAHTNFCLGMILLEREEREEGLAYLAKAKGISRAINCRTSGYLSLISEAWYFLRKGEEAAGLVALAKAMTIGREQRFMSHSAWRSDLMSFLCAKALETGIETDYVRELIEQRGLLPPDVAQLNLQPSIHSLTLERWPWSLKIHTLGKFEILKNDTPVTFPGKVQQKPLALLKAIIARGCRDVNRQQLTDDLWPDADGYQANKSLEIALHRLRKLISDEKAVQLSQGLVTLDPRCCWVDVPAVERIMDQAEDVLKRKPTQETAAALSPYTQKILSLYGGHFLERETEQSWNVTLRERLRARFLHFIARCGQHLEEAKQYEMAVECLEKGLERDNLYEEFYQRLMICHHRLGRQAAARDVYFRCRAVLSALLSAETSPKTEEIYARIR